MTSQRKIRNVVVMGGSEGAWEAMARILGALPAGLPATILAVVTTPDPAATVAHVAVLQSRSALPVAFAVDGSEALPGHVYICPPAMRMTLDTSMVIALAFQEDGGSAPSAVDALFSAVAEGHGRRVVAVILSGDLEDGVRGLRDIEAAGGIGIVQSPCDALDPRSPSNAVAKDHPDVVSMLDAIAPLMCRLIGGAQRE